MVRRVKLGLAPGVVVEFVDRDRGLGQVSEVADRGTRLPLVVYGPEGCGKTAFLRQAVLLLEERGYSVIYVSPLQRDARDVLVYSESLRSLVRDVLKAVPEPYSRIADVAVHLAVYIVRRVSRPRLALLLDDVFQAIGLERVEAYVKTLLNLIEHPPGDYERIVVVVASGEGLSRERLARHSWISPRMMWNMGVEGFRALYGRLPGEKPSFHEVWRLTGGNPRLLARLYQVGWDAGALVDELVEEKELTRLIGALGGRERRLLSEVLEDPDALIEHLGEEAGRRLERLLVEYNLVSRVYRRSAHLWIDYVPPRRDHELGIGELYAWQAPVYRDAVRRVVEGV